MRTCVNCFRVIQEARLQALPGCTTCVDCSSTPKHFGLMDFSHKTAGSVVIVDGGDKESIRRMKMVYERKR
jgi:hypothetical protein